MITEFAVIISAAATVAAYKVYTARVAHVQQTYEKRLSKPINNFFVDEFESIWNPQTVKCGYCQRVFDYRAEGDNCKSCGAPTIPPRPKFSEPKAQ